MKGTEFLKKEPLGLKLCYLLALMAFLANMVYFFSTGENNAYVTIGFNLVLIIFILRFVTWSGKQSDS